MKKYHLSHMLTAVFLCFALTGCGKAASPDTAQGAGLPENRQETRSQSADVDLTQLSSTMVYAEVYNMLDAPEDYMGKTVKMSGSFAVYEGETQNYYACIIADATACCSQGIEFVLDDDFAYPDDYPELGSAITVTGEFSTYREGDYRYATLIHAVMGE